MQQKYSFLRWIQLNCLRLFYGGDFSPSFINEKGLIPFFPHMVGKVFSFPLVPSWERSFSFFSLSPGGRGVGEEEDIFIINWCHKSGMRVCPENTVNREQFKNHPHPDLLP